MTRHRKQRHRKRPAGLIILGLVLTAASGMVVLMVAEEPAALPPEVTEAPALHTPPARKEDSPVWMTQSGRLVERTEAGRPVQWVAVEAHGRPRQAHERCSGLLTALAEPQGQVRSNEPGCGSGALSAPAWLAEATGAWMLVQALPTDLVELSLAEIEPGDDAFMVEFALMRGLMAQRYRGDRDPLTGERLVDRVTAKRVTLFADERGCRTALARLPALVRRPPVELDLNRLEQAAEQQRLRAAENCKPEQAPGSSKSRCEVSRLVLAHLEAHLATRRSSQPLAPPACRSAWGKLEAQAR